MAVATVIGLAMTQRALASDADTFYRDVKARAYAQAVAHGSVYLASHPTDDVFAIDLAYAYLNLSDRDEARRILLDRGPYFAAHPDAASIWLALSYQDSANQEYRPAIADVDHYLRYHPDDRPAWQQRDVAAAALAPPPSSSSPDESVRFYGAVAAGHYDEALPYGKRYLAAHAANGAFAVDLAYAYIQAKDLSAAAALTNEYATYIDSDKNAVKLLAALFYAYNAAGETQPALLYGRKYLALSPSDGTFAMDLTYAELKAGNVADARAILAANEAYLRAHPEAAKVWLDLSYRDADAKQYPQAIADVDSYLTIDPTDAQARVQREDYVSDLHGGPREGLYGYSYYDSRFDDTFFGADETYALSRPGQGVQPYLVAHLSDDTKSGPPGSPQIYSDDALIADFGLRTALTPHITAFVEGGVGIGLRGQGTISDARYGGLYSQEWGKLGHDFTSIDTSVAVYSRYAGNTIGYLNALHIFPGRTVRPLFGINGGLDSHSVYGNNFVEAVYGIQAGTTAVSYRLVGVEGEYLTRGTIRPQPAYSGVRAMLVFGFSK